MKSREQIQEQYNNLKELREILHNTAKNLDALNISNEIDTYKYRIDSVYRVLDYIAENYKTIKPRELEMCIVHCMNKLNGNIDGIELILNREDENK